MKNVNAPQAIDFASKINLSRSNEQTIAKRLTLRSMQRVSRTLMIRHYISNFPFRTVSLVPAGELAEDRRFSQRSIGRRRTAFSALNAFEPSCTREQPSKPSCTATVAPTQSDAGNARRSLVLAAHRIVPIPDQTSFADLVCSLEETGAASDSELRHAVSEWLRQEERAGRFGMNFQPLYERPPSAPGRLGPDARKISHFEALIRHPHYRPAEFIPAVEKWAPVEFALLALRIAAQAARQHPDAAFSVNIPGTAFSDKRLPMLVKSVLDETGIDPHRIMIEVTETGLLPDIRRMRAALHALREAGHKIAIDDYDMGHTRYYLSALLNGPFSPSLYDLVKTDRECVQLMNLSRYPELQRKMKIIEDTSAPLTMQQRRDIEEIEHDAFEAFLTLVRDMHKRGIRVAAEGVEYPVEAALLDSINVDIQQGFVHSKPRPTPSVA